MGISGLINFISMGESMKYSTRLLASVALGALMALPAAVPANAAVNEIIVTATKRAENIQDIPVAVTAFTSEMLQSNNILDIHALADYVPGFEFVQSTGRDFERPVIRGQSNIFGESGVSFFIDGVYFSGSLSTIDLSEVQTLEVIKGPQSALYGRNTYSGAINITTKRPGNEYKASASAEYGEHKYHQFTGSLSGPIVKDILSVGVYLRDYKFGGDHRNAFDNSRLGGEKSQSIATTVMFTPNEDWEIMYRGVLARDNDGPPDMFLQLPSTNNVGFETGGDMIGEFFKGEIKAQQGNIDNLLVKGFKPGTRQERQEHSVSIKWKATDAFTVDAVFGFQNDENRQKLDFDFQPTSIFTPIPAISFGEIFPVLNVPGFRGSAFGFGVVPILPHVDTVTDTETISQEIRVSYDEGGPFRAMFGGYFYRNVVSARDLANDVATLADPTIGPLIQAAVDSSAAAACPTTGFFDTTTLQFVQCFFPLFAAPLVVDGRTNSDTRTRDWALFGKYDFDVTSKLTVSAEWRYQEERFKSSIFAFSDSSVSRTGDTFETTTMRFSGTYKLNDDSLLYLVGAKGTKPGGSNGATGLRTFPAPRPTFGDEKVWSVEAGSKNHFFDNQVLFNVDVYYNFISGYQLSQTALQSTDGINVDGIDSIVVNKGSVHVYGLELETALQPKILPGMTVNFNYSYNDSEFQAGATDTNEGILADIADDGLKNCSLGNTDVRPGRCTPAAASIAGRRLPRSAHHQLSGGVNYKGPLVGQVDWFAGVTANYTSKKFVQVQNLATFGDAVLVNLNVGVSTKNFSITAWGKNVFDEGSVLSASKFVDFSNFERAFFANRRRASQWGVTARANF